jgi:hypothetical protein
MNVSPSNGSGTVDPTAGSQGRHEQVRQLIKQALEMPTAQGFAGFLEFGCKFRRLAIWNARMAYIQRPGAKAIATEYEWTTVGRQVLADAVPIIILWPFSPIRFVYELADTGPDVDRDEIGDPFGVRGELEKGALGRLARGLGHQKKFRILIEPRRQGFHYAGSAAPIDGAHPIPGADSLEEDGGEFAEFAHEHGFTIDERTQSVPSYRVTVNDRLSEAEQFVTVAHELGHIFCGHLGACGTSSHGGSQDESGWPDRRHLGKREREVEAESVAYLVAARAGILTRSAEYISEYASNATMEHVNVDLVVRAAARVERLAEIHHGRLAFQSDGH